jgi:saccharopine dehydrogenase (NAD+, L-lysine-forming)
MGNPKLIYLRSELNSNEYRCPITPQDVNKLISAGITIYVESSNNRIFDNVEYIKVGAIITTDPWYTQKFQSGLIIGLKDIPNLEKLSNHNHIYFSHTFKNQKNSELILKEFKSSNSILYDFEYLLDDNNKRLIAFGYYAGFVGCCLGLMQYYTKRKTNTNIKDLKPFVSKTELINQVTICKNFAHLTNIKIAVIGNNGRCGKGVIDVLDSLNINYITLNKEEQKRKLEDFDIIYNCIVLNKSLNEVWLDKNTNFNKHLTIVDISCDYNSVNNPIKLYNEATTWKEPVFSHNEYVDIIGINNLPSLLPKDSSEEFSEILVKLLLNFNDKTWNKCKNIYEEIINNL